MSYELADCRIEDMRAEVWKLTRVTFTGAAILLREKAAYKGTSFALGKDSRRASALSAQPSTVGRQLMAVCEELARSS